MALVNPHGKEKKLKPLLVAGAALDAEKKKAAGLKKINISSRETGDLIMMGIGGFTPLTGFMTKADWKGVCADYKMADGTFWPIPITVSCSKADADGIKDGGEIALFSTEFNEIMATMKVAEKYSVDKAYECQQVYKTTDVEHPGVKMVMDQLEINLAGPVKVLSQGTFPTEYPTLFQTPAQSRAMFEEKGWSRVAAFQTRNPMHRSHEYLAKIAVEVTDGVYIHMLLGKLKPGDIPSDVRQKCIDVLVEKYFVKNTVMVGGYPLDMRYAGPREALLHAVFRQNYGCSHLIVGRDHAGPGNDSSGKPFYGPYDAQEMMTQYESEIGVKMVPFEMLVYLPDEDRYVEVKDVPEGAKTLNISGTQVREDYLAKGRLLPEWFTRPETAEILRQSYPPRHDQGFCIWFTGLSGSGKSATTQVLTDLLLERGKILTVLDGDVVRTHLSKGLGFSKEDRDTNILRIGFVAGELVRHGGSVVCAAISPYRNARNEARKMVGDNFIMVHMDTPVEVCEQRDVKGLYAKARQAMIDGKPMGFTGVDDPYEEPIDPEITLAGVGVTPEENARQIIAYLEEQGYLQPQAT